jgi:hypothetical protein
MQFVSPEFITALAGIPIGTLAVWLMYRLSSNHIDHNTQSIDKLVDATHDQTNVHTEFYGWMKGRETARDKREISHHDETP